MEGDACNMEDKDENAAKNSNPKKIVQLLYDQKRSNDKKELALFSEPEPYIP